MHFYLKNYIIPRESNRIKISVPLGQNLFFLLCGHSGQVAACLEKWHCFGFLEGIKFLRPSGVPLSPKILLVWGLMQPPWLNHGACLDCIWHPLYGTGASPPLAVQCRALLALPAL